MDSRAKRGHGPGGCAAKPRGRRRNQRRTRGFVRTGPRHAGVPNHWRHPTAQRYESPHGQKAAHPPPDAPSPDRAAPSRARRGCAGRVRGALPGSALAGLPRADDQWRDARPRDLGAADRDGQPGRGRNELLLPLRRDAAYGLQTPAASAGAGTAKMRVGTAIAGLVPGGTYHYRVIAVNANGTAEGRDRTFKARGHSARVRSAEIRDRRVRHAADPDGRAQRPGGGVPPGRAAGQPVPVPRTVCRASACPGPRTRLGRFSFRVANLLASTQLRVTTLDPLPIYSRLITVSVAVRVTLHVRSSGRRGSCGCTARSPGRQEGQGLPAGAQSRSARTATKTRPAGRASSRPRRRRTAATARASASSPSVRHAGRYRAFVRLGPGPLVSGASSTVLLHAAPGAKKN